MLADHALLCMWSETYVECFMAPSLDRESMLGASQEQYMHAVHLDDD